MKPNSVLLIFAATLLVPLIFLQQAIGEPRFTWRVVNVAESDPEGLNVRDSVIEAETVGDTSVVGQLSWNAHGIAASGRQVEIAGSYWMEIKQGALEGWVNSKYLVRETGNQLPEITPADLICSGTEPFWGLKMSVVPALYSGEDWIGGQWSDDMKLDLLARDTIVEMGEGSWAVTLKRREKEQYLRGVINKASPLCNDSMSNLLYPYEMILLKGKVPRPVYGCCYLDFRK